MASFDSTFTTDIDSFQSTARLGLSTAPWQEYPMNRLALIPLLFSLLPACADPPPQPLGEAALPIIGGTPTSGDPAVVLLISYPTDKSTFATCTAVAISPTVLITAAHCVDQPNHPGHVFGAFTGPDASSYTTADALSQVLVPATTALPHPDYNPNSPFYADVGVVVLAQPIAAPPLPFNRDPVSPSLVGTPARIVGYGQTVYGQFNVIKHQATTIVAGIDATQDTIVVGDSAHRTCVGDSGGPALVNMAGVETIVGLDSYTDNSGCIEAAHFRRTDLFAAFFDSYAPPVASGAGPTGAGPTGAAGVGGGASATGGWGEGGGGGSPGTNESEGGCTVAMGRASGIPALASFLVAIAFGLRAVNRRRARR